MRTRPVLIAAVLCAFPASAGAPDAGQPALSPLFAATPGMGSILVARGGRTTLEAYFNGAGPDTLHDTRSAMKSITSLAVGIAIAEGHIRSVSAPAFAHLTSLRPFKNDGPLKAAITVEDLLTMSSALDCNDDDPKSPGNEEKMYPLEKWARWAVDLPVDPGYARDASGRGRFSYCTAGTLLLGQIIEAASRRRVDRFVEEKLLDPLGIKAREWPRSPSGEVMTGGGLRLRTQDLARIAQMVLDGGRWKERQIVPKEFVSRALTVHRKAVNAEQDYGYLFWRRDYSTRCGRTSGWFMGGNGGNAIVILKDLDAVIVITRTAYNVRGMHQQTTRLLEKLLLPELMCPK